MTSRRRLELPNAASRQWNASLYDERAEQLPWETKVRELVKFTIPLSVTMEDRVSPSAGE